LHLDNNLLTVLPPEFGQLKELSTLVLDNNELTSLPRRFNSVRFLSVKQNRLTALPASLRESPNLTHLNLRGNPGLNLPPGVLAPTHPRLGHAGWQDLCRSDHPQYVGKWGGASAARSSRPR